MLSLFAELLLQQHLRVDRDEVPEPLAEGFGDQLQVTGAGTGLGGSNLDLEFDVSPERTVLVGEVKVALGAPPRRTRLRSAGCHPKQVGAG